MWALRASAEAPAHYQAAFPDIRQLHLTVRGVARAPAESFCAALLEVGVSALAIAEQFEARGGKPREHRTNDS